MAEADAPRIDLISDLEKDVQKIAHDRWVKKGEEDLGRAPPTFFWGNKDWNMPPIEEVVKWSKTSRGGKQFSIFRDDEIEPGCMSWGLCDTGDLDG